MASEGTQTALAAVPAVEEASLAPTYEEIQALAYALWVERGYPHGSADEDWLAAEQRLTSQKAERTPK